jgi:hypothetical protein
MNFDLQEYLTTKRPLRFRPDRKFRLLLLADAHGGTQPHPQLFSGIDAIIEQAKPDVVLFMGDQCGHRIGCAATGELYDYLALLTRTLERQGIPWAHVYGNHDYNLGITNEEAQKVYETFPYCISKRGPEDIHGVGNYVLPVLHADSDTPAFNIWGMDTHDDNKCFAQTYNLQEDTQFILPEHFAFGYHSDNQHTDQLIWYYQTSLAIEQAFGRKIPGILYQHIPLPEFCLIPRNPQHTDMAGNMREHVGTNELNCGLFSACLQRGDIRGIFAGHDHLNDYCGVYCGVMLGACAGINYDCGSHDDLRGGRVIDIEENNPWHIQTHMLRLRDVMGAAISDNRGRPEL